MANISPSPTASWSRCTITAVFCRRGTGVFRSGSDFVGEVGREVAAALGSKPAILLRGNGQVTVAERFPKP